MPSDIPDASSPAATEPGSPDKEEKTQPLDSGDNLECNESMASPDESQCMTTANPYAYAKKTYCGGPLIYRAPTPENEGCAKELFAADDEKTRNADLKDASGIEQSIPEVSVQTSEPVVTSSAVLPSPTTSEFSQLMARATQEDEAQDGPAVERTATGEGFGRVPSVPNDNVVAVPRTLSEAVASLVADPGPSVGNDAVMADNEKFTYDGPKRLRSFSASPPKDARRVSGPRDESGDEAEDRPPKLQRT